MITVAPPPRVRVSDAVWMALITMVGGLLTLIIHYVARSYLANKRAKAKTPEARRAYDEADDLEGENKDD